MPPVSDSTPVVDDTFAPTDSSWFASSVTLPAPFAVTAFVSVMPAPDDTSDTSPLAADATAPPAFVIAPVAVTSIVRAELMPARSVAPWMLRNTPSVATPDAPDVAASVAPPSVRSIAAAPAAPTLPVVAVSDTAPAVVATFSLPAPSPARLSVMFPFAETVTLPVVLCTRFSATLPVAEVSVTLPAPFAVTAFVSVTSAPVDASRMSPLFADATAPPAFVIAPVAVTSIVRPELIAKPAPPRSTAPCTLRNTPSVAAPDAPDVADSVAAPSDRSIAAAPAAPTLPVVPVSTTAPAVVDTFSLPAPSPPNASVTLPLADTVTLPVFTTRPSATLPAVDATVTWPPAAVVVAVAPIVTSPVVAVTPMVPAPPVDRFAVCDTPVPPVSDSTPVVDDTFAPTDSSWFAFSVTLPEPFAVTRFDSVMPPAPVLRSMLPLPAVVTVPPALVSRPPAATVTSPLPVVLTPARSTPVDSVTFTPPVTLVADSVVASVLAVTPSSAVRLTVLPVIRPAPLIAPSVSGVVSLASRSASTVTVLPVAVTVPPMATSSAAAIRMVPVPDATLPPFTLTSAFALLASRASRTTAPLRAETVAPLVSMLPSVVISVSVPVSNVLLKLVSSCTSSASVMLTLPAVAPLVTVSVLAAVLAVTPSSAVRITVLPVIRPAPLIAPSVSGVVSLASRSASTVTVLPVAVTVPPMATSSAAAIRMVPVPDATLPPFTLTSAFALLASRASRTTAPLRAETVAPLVSMLPSVVISVSVPVSKALLKLVSSCTSSASVMLTLPPVAPLVTVSVPAAVFEAMPVCAESTTAGAVIRPAPPMDAADVSDALVTEVMPSEFSAFACCVMVSAPTPAVAPMV